MATPNTDPENWARLPPGHEPMSEEEWERNKLCELAKRDHKWRWKSEPGSSIPVLDRAVCVHCGIETKLVR